MSVLYVSPFAAEGSLRFGLFYDDVNGNRQPHKENWQHVAFDTEKEATIRLFEIESERNREDAAEPLSLEEAKVFAENHAWKFAKTYADSAPHEYLVKNWLSDEDKL